MLGSLLTELETLERLDRCAETRAVVVRMARLASHGRLRAFVDVVGADQELDERTRRWVLDLARHEPFLLATAKYAALQREA
jgi:hypothetical protein